MSTPNTGTGAPYSRAQFGELSPDAGAAPAGEVYKFLGVDVEHLVAAVKAVV